MMGPILPLCLLLGMNEALDISKFNQYHTVGLEKRQDGASEHDKYSSLFYPMHSHANCHCLSPDSAWKYFGQEEPRHWTGTESECQHNPAHRDRSTRTLGDIQ